MNKIEVGQEMNLNIKQIEGFDIIYLNQLEKIDYFIKKNEERKILLFGKNKNHITCHLEENSSLLMIYVSKNSNDKVNIYLDGKNSNVSFYYRTINEFNELNQEFNINVYHNNDNTISSLQNHGVNLQNGSMKFYVNGIVDKNLKDVVCNQVNQIVEMENGSSIIIPNLLIDTNEVIANHSAYISKFREEELFYLQLRGINKDDCYNLLKINFVLSKLNISEKLQEEIIKYFNF